MTGGCNTGSSVNKNDPMVQYALKQREEHAKIQDKDYSHVFRKKSRFDMMRMSAIVIGIEFAYSAETAFVSPILLQIGIDHQRMTMVWALSPILGFFIAPLLGSLSDRCRLGLGRRRPIITLLSMLLIVGLILVPHGKTLGLLLGDTEATEDTPAVFTTSIVLTILGVVFLDFNADTCQTPSRSYVLDITVPWEQNKGMSTFSIMAGVGGTFGCALGGVDWKKTSVGAALGGNIPTVFTIVTVVFVLCYITTLTSFREIPLPLLEKDELLKPLTLSSLKKQLAKENEKLKYIKDSTALELQFAISDEKTSIEPPAYEKPVSPLENPPMVEVLKPVSPLENPPMIINGDVELANEAEEEDDVISLKEYLKSIVVMPKSMWLLCLTNLFCWMSHLCYNLYFTDYVGQAVFGGNPTGPEGSESRELYEEGVRFGCWGLSIYALSCSIYSAIIDKLIKWFGVKKVYMGGCLGYAIGMLILALVPTKAGVLALSTTAGMIYATLFTMPFILVASYHTSGCFKVKKGEQVALKQPRGLGTDVAIVGSMIFVAQIIVSMTIGTFIEWLGTPATVLYGASIL
ncbi:hypothetical protein ACFFRR_007964, partial [Megaselia abdita]